jgi:hypothetical protein
MTFVNVVGSVKGTDYNIEKITIPIRNNKNVINYAINSKGDLKTYCVADLIE